MVTLVVLQLLPVLAAGVLLPGVEPIERIPEISNRLVNGFLHPLSLRDFGGCHLKRLAGFFFASTTHGRRWGRGMLREGFYTRAELLQEDRR